MYKLFQVTRPPSLRQCELSCSELTNATNLAVTDLRAGRLNGISDPIKLGKSLKYRPRINRLPALAYILL